MDYRDDSTGMFRCTAKNCKADQWKCDKFAKASFENRCMFLVYGQFCDWHPHMACNQPKETTPTPAAPEETKVRWGKWGDWRNDA